MQGECPLFLQERGLIYRSAGMVENYPGHKFRLSGPSGNPEWVNNRITGTCTQAFKEGRKQDVLAG